MILRKKIKKNYCFTKTSIFVIIFLIFFNYSYAQKITYPKQQIGVGYSSFSGTGINYLIEINKYSAFQIAGIVYYFGEKPPDDLNFYTIIGAEYQYSFLKEKDYRLYSFLGFSMLQLEKRRISIITENDRIITTKTIETDNIYNYGIGVGIEFKLSPQFSLSTNLGFLHQKSDISNFSEFWDRNPSGTIFNGLGVSIAIRYVF